MKQDLKDGNTILEEVPAPLVKSGQVLIQTTRSLVSLGTERMEFGKAGVIERSNLLSVMLQKYLYLQSGT